jgi:hypothetical protein
MVPNSTDGLIVRTDSLGRLVWNYSIGGAGIDWFYDLCLTNDGGMAATGYTSSLGQGQHDIWLVKLGGEINHGPVFISTANSLQRGISPGTLYQDTIKAMDFDWEDRVWYALAPPSPAGMTIDSLNGAIQWTPSWLDLGTTIVAAVIHDKQGLSDTLQYSLYVGNDTLFYENFDDDTAQGFQYKGGQWAIQGTTKNKYLIQLNSGSFSVSRALFGDTSWTNIDYSLNFKMLNQGQIIFNMAYHDSVENGNLIIVDNSRSILQCIDKDGGILQSVPFATALNAWYTMRLVRYANKVQFSLNDTVRLFFTMASPGRGWLGMGTGENMRAAFDEVLIVRSDTLEDINDIYTPTGSGENRDVYFNRIYPNPYPFGNLLNIAISGTENAVVTIFDRSGHRINKLIRDKNQVKMVWDGNDEFGAVVPEGIYYVQIEQKGIRELRKILKIK